MAPGARGLRVSFDAEKGRADRPFTPRSDKEFHTENARVQWRKDDLRIGFQFKNQANDNGASLLGYSARGKQYSVNASWTPASDRVLFDLSYSHLDIDTESGIFNFLEAVEPSDELQRRSFYTSNLHTFYAGSRLRLHKRVDLYLAYTIAKDTGDGRGAPTFTSGSGSRVPQL